MSKSVGGKQIVVSPTKEASCTLCQSPDSSRMVACDVCGLWYHFKCVGVNESIQDRDWSCEQCAGARAQVPVGFSTPLAGGNIGQNIQQDHPDRELRRQMEVLQRRFDDQQKAFEKLLREKDDQLKALTHPGEQTVLDSHVPGRLPEMQSNLLKSTGAIPKACSTTIHAAKGDASGGVYNRLELELELLEQKHTLEKKQLSERYNVLQRFGAEDSTCLSEQYRANPSGMHNEFVRGRDETHVNDLSLARSSPELNRSQLAARQAVARDLPTFSGNPEEWPLFIASFESSTRVCGFSDEENLLRLQRSLRGKALESVRSRLLHPSCLAGVITTLRVLYGRPEIIIHSLINRIREMPAPKAEKLNTLIDFGVSVQNMCATIKACGVDEYLCNVALLQELVDRLPATIKLNWAMHRQKLKRSTLSDFGDWLGELVEAACVVTLPSTNLAANAERRGRKNSNFVNVHCDSDSITSASDEISTTVVSRSPGKECLVCNQGCSSPEHCRRFQSMDVNSRWSFLKEHKLCRKCLRKHYGSCTIKTACGRNGCKFMHNKMLHDDSRYNSTPPNNQISLQQSCNTHLALKGKILFKYVPVTIYGNGTSVNTYAFLDDGSSATFMEHDLLNELKLNGTPHPLCLNWTSGQQRDESESVKLSLRISAVSNPNKVFELPKVHTVRSLSLPQQSVKMSQLSARFDHLSGLPIESYDTIAPRILIGIDNWKLSQAVDSREGRDDQPAAAKTRLGWIIYGPCSEASRASNANYLSYHSFHICACSSKVDTDLNSALKDYFSIDSMGVYKSNKQLLSKDDERAHKLLSHLTKRKNNRYETGLLWRHDNVTLPDNRDMANKRLVCLEKRMSRDPELAVTLREKINEYKQKGYIRKLSSDEITVRHPRMWYLPIFPVINPNKPGKVRIVWDAAASVAGVSLNSQLLTGPDQLESLTSVLYRFREFRFAITGDIKEMYHQILIKEDDQQSQRFLWRDGDARKQPDVYVMNVMTFGATCSPSCALYVKDRNAEKYQQQFPRAVQCIKREHYVDDMLSSEESEEAAANLANNVRFIHSKAGFEIRNWLSNSRKVLAKLKAIETLEKSMSFGAEMATEKVLGMWWCTDSDTFTFRLSARHDRNLLSGNRVPTKREVLRTLMTVYDPLGLLAPFLMYLKILLQEIWRSHVTWDEEIPENLDAKWKLWLLVLPQIEDVRVPRCYRLNTTAEVTTHIQLHIFVDASEKGFAAVAYIRYNEKEIVECALVGAKTRVAPLKFLSIPRLELQAAVIGARLAKNIIESHRIPISKRYFWTDSRNVLCWLRSDHRRYSQFVAFRVSELLDLTEIGEWRWLSTKQNVADEGTKWQKLPDLRPNSRWFRGPDFLWKTENEWPESVKDSGQTREEIRVSMMHHVIWEPVLNVDNFSTWKRLLRTVAYIKRFPTNLRNKIAGESIITGPLTQSELLDAEYVIYRQVQQQKYSKEISILGKSEDCTEKRWCALPKNSTLYKLTPFVDNKGILRIHGRIDACEYAKDTVKRPIILPKEHHVTTLIVAEYHKRFCHLNHQTVINEIRNKYHISKLQATYNRIRRSCQQCKIQQAVPHPPIMGDLPESRLAAFIRPFSYTGIDYFGPMKVVVGRRVEKRWGVLLTCMTIRAIHIEIAHSLTTDSCILSLRNFIARRGAPLELISDCGTNFVGANRELRDAFEKVNQIKMMEYFESSDMKWTFNPPAAPHFGGCWERMIQSVKRILERIKTRRLPTDEILRNMLLETEMIVNSRPLTHVPLQDENSTPITPNHFLLGSSNGSKPPIAFDDTPIMIRHSWKMSQAFADEFWKKWVNEYLPTLTRRTKWFQPVKPIEVGDIVLVVDNKSPRNCWPKGRVISVCLSKDGQVRRATVQTTHGPLERPAVKLAILDVGSSHSKPSQ